MRRAEDEAREESPQAENAQVKPVCLPWVDSAAANCLPAKMKSPLHYVAKGVI